VNHPRKETEGVSAIIVVATSRHKINHESNLSDSDKEIANIG